MPRPVNDIGTQAIVELTVLRSKVLSQKCWAEKVEQLIYFISLVRVQVIVKKPLLVYLELTIAFCALAISLFHTLACWHWTWYDPIRSRR